MVPDDAIFHARLDGWLTPHPVQGILPLRQEAHDGAAASRREGKDTTHAGAFPSANAWASRCERSMISATTPSSLSYTARRGQIQVFGFGMAAVFPGPPLPRGTGERESLGGPRTATLFDREYVSQKGESVMRIAVLGT